MKKGFSLLELVIVLMIISLVAVVTFPAFVNFGSSSQENFENRLKTAMSSLFSFSKTIELCADFKKNVIQVREEEIELPAGKELEYMILPNKVVSSEISSKFCISSKSPEVVGFLAKESSERYLSILVLLPSGEVSINSLSQGEGETFKDKILKGRIVEWFSFFSY
jgi:prepilin-type N-terminal cleavage/methylation domain-containing protein